jgi:hypothetical protein
MVSPVRRGPPEIGLLNNCAGCVPSTVENANVMGCERALPLRSRSTVWFWAVPPTSWHK